MAQNRTFQFRGVGYGDTPVTVIATANGVEIFNGTIPTLSGPVPDVYPTPDAAYETVAFSLENSAEYNTNFRGSVPMEITVTGGSHAIFTDILCNYYGNVSADPNAGSAEHFAPCYNGQPVNSESTLDARSSVFVNGTQQVPDLCPASTGGWVWAVSNPGTITYNWNISRGQD